MSVVYVFNDNTRYKYPGKTFTCYTGDTHISTLAHQTSDAYERYSTENVYVAREIFKRVLSEVNTEATGERTSPDVFIDATACIGGHTMEAIKWFPNVIAVEQNTLRFDTLCSRLNTVATEVHQDVMNCRHFIRSKDLELVDGVTSPRITNIYVFNLDFVVYMSELLKFAKQISRNNQYVVDLDPPWGGPAIMRKQHIIFGLSNMSLSTVIKSVQAQLECVHVFCKFPSNFFMPAVQRVFKNITPTGRSKYKLLLFPP